MRPTRLTQLLALSAVSCALLSSPARAEQPQMPPCNCNDDCKGKYPYSGICIDWGYGNHYCGWNGAGIPCSDGGPKPTDGGPPSNDAWPPPPNDFGPDDWKVPDWGPKDDWWFGCGDAFPSCSCNDDCKGRGFAYCVKSANPKCGAICSNHNGPGIACVKSDMDRSCNCNSDCATLKATPYCGLVNGARVCTAVGPGLTCQVGGEADYPRGDDMPPRSDAGVSSATPRGGGCSVGSDVSGGDGASAGLLALSLLGLVAIQRRRDR